MMSCVVIDVKKLIAEAEKMSKSERSYWKRGVASLIRDYGEDVLGEHDGEEVDHEGFERLFGCGCDDLCSSYYGVLYGAVYGGCYDVYNYGIAKRFCTPSEFKRTKEGMREPNREENWLDLELRGLVQAIRLAWSILAK